MKIFPIILITLTVALGGCVGKQKYETALEESATRQAEIERLNEELNNANKSNEELSAARDSLSTELDTTNNEKLALHAERDTLTGEVASLSAKSEELQKEKTSISSAKEEEVSNLKNIYEDLLTELNSEIEQGDIKITTAIDRLSLQFVDKILFASGKAQVKKEGLNVLKRMGEILKGVADKQIRVEGHTDNVSIGSVLRETYPTNWELSTARATNVVRYLQDEVGIDPALLSVGGFSKFKPVASNDTDEGRMQNRRIEIVLLPVDIDRVLEELKK